MKGMVPLDSQSGVSKRQYAVVKISNKSRKRNRKRFPASCVTVIDSKEEAMRVASNQDNMFAAVVIGPSRSSESQYIYYLGEWL